jgi:glycosyltransferase involved in cell wall biosynthesis
MTEPLVTIAVPSFNQGRFLADALDSIFAQNVPVEVFVMDGGSTDGSREIIERRADRLAGWRSGPDDGQSAAINEGIARGRAPHVCWLNSDDLFLDGGLGRLLNALVENPQAPGVFGRVWNLDEASGRRTAAWTQPFTERNLSLRCIVSQPGSLLRRAVWDGLGGLDGSLRMAMDYDLWWRVYRRFGAMAEVPDFVAVNREHEATKTRTQRRLHYREAMQLVRRYHGRLPWKWWLYYPYAVWWRSVF